MDSSNKHSGIKDRKRWIDLMNESVHTSDDIDIGDIDAVSRDFIVVKRGFVNVHYYYFPIGKVEAWTAPCVAKGARRIYQKEL